MANCLSRHIIQNLIILITIFYTLSKELNVYFVCHCHAEMLLRMLLFLCINVLKVIDFDLIETSLF